MHSLLFSASVLALMPTGCKKDDDPAPEATGHAAQIFSVPLPGIFTWVEDATTISYLQTDDLGGPVFKELGSTSFR
ncbi:MAG: hypothetical protein IPI00_16645 [Flavobacteriales bacterium]|nr:hypothetical protein [Flavobacteriales bacterium]MBK6945644.1 hypothetical protein [Flavobacteriales bacterium]MBK7241750.1 hypothetical protein [Flavobacteriales bacterium]MBK7296247.1 hypothetical protein [Flavobacteriales bacterium]MBK9534804.1 hypothetical protein [Flavobacteriales bacterium]